MTEPTRSRSEQITAMLAPYTKLYADLPGDRRASIVSPSVLRQAVEQNVAKRGTPRWLRTRPKRTVAPSGRGGSATVQSTYIEPNLAFVFRVLYDHAKPGGEYRSVTPVLDAKFLADLGAEHYGHPTYDQWDLTIATLKRLTSS